MHFLGKVLALVPKGNNEMVAAAIRTIFARPHAEHGTEQFDVIASMLGRHLPKVEAMLRDAHEDLLAFTSFANSHWKKIWSTNPLDWHNKEVKRRTDVVGVRLPNREALLGGGPARSWSRPRTNGLSAPNAATYPKGRWRY